MARVLDFSRPDDSLGHVRAEFFGRVLALVSDVALVVEAGSGKVLDIAKGSPALGRLDHSGMLDRTVYEMVTTESQAKIRDLLIGPDSVKWRQVNLLTDGEDLPIAFRSIRLTEERVLLAGREDERLALAQRRFAGAQRELELTFSRLRQSDQRYRSLLNLLDLAIVLVEMPRGRIAELSDKAAGLLGTEARRMQGRLVAEFFGPDGRDAIVDLLERAVAENRSVAGEATMKDGTIRRVRAAPFHSGNGRQILLHLLDRAECDGGQDRSMELFANLPYGVVVTDEDMVVRHTNAAFRRLLDLSGDDAAQGRLLEDFIGSRGLETAIMAAELRDHGAFHNFASLAVGEGGDPIEVDVDGARATGRDGAVFAFLVRPRFSGPNGDQAAPAPDSGFAAQVRDNVGRVGLKAIVRQTTDSIEKTAIERALELTGNNRAAAAEMLGVSRQNLYDKIDRFGIGTEA